MPTWANVGEPEPWGFAVKVIDGGIFPYNSITHSWAIGHVSPLNAMSHFEEGGVVRVGEIRSSGRAGAGKTASSVEPLGRKVPFRHPELDGRKIFCRRPLDDRAHQQLADPHSSRVWPDPHSDQHCLRCVFAILRAANRSHRMRIDDRDELSPIGNPHSPIFLSKRKFASER